MDYDSKESSSVRFISRNLIIYDSDPKNLIPIDSNQKSKLNVKRSLCVKHVEKDLLQIMCYKIILFNVRLFLHIRLNSGGKKHFLCSICNKQFDIVFNLLIQRNRPRGPEEKNFVNMHLLNMCSFSAEPNMSHLSDLHSYWI